MIILLFLIVILIMVVIFWQMSTLISIKGGIQYVGSGKKVFESAFKLARVNKDAVVYELGSGFGEGLLIAANEFEASAIGIEISPFHYIFSKIKTLGNKNIKIYFGNYHNFNLSSADVVYCYLTPVMLEQLMPKFTRELKRGSLLISRSFKIPKMEILKSESIGKTSVYVYKI